MAIGEQRVYEVVTARSECGTICLPVLVHQSTWLPLLLPLRWVCTIRRLEVAESTLRGNLDGLRVLFEWADTKIEGGLEPLLLSGGRLTKNQLTLLVARLRVGRNPFERLAAGKKAACAQTVARMALACRLFLKWALEPASRGQPGAAPGDLSEAKDLIDAVFEPILNVDEGGRRELIKEDVLECIEELISPLKRPDGKYFVPLRFSNRNGQLKC